MSGSRAGEGLRRLPDEGLVRLAAEIDPAAFEVLYERHHVLAFSLAYRIAGSRERAEEIVQDAFLSVWRGAGTFDPARGSVRTWLMATVRHRGIDAVRRLSSRERVQAEAVALTPRAAASDLAIAEADARDQGHVIRAALQSLPSEQRKVIELAFYGGWTQREIAERLDVPLGTVKGRARLGLLKLHAALSGEVQTPP